MEHFSNIEVTEVFLEATPTTFVTTVLLMASLPPGQLQFSIVLIGIDTTSTVLFLVGYAASILSSAFGVSR